MPGILHPAPQKIWLSLFMSVISKKVEETNVWNTTINNTISMIQPQHELSTKNANKKFLTEQHSMHIQTTIIPALAGIQGDESGSGGKGTLIFPPQIH